MLSPKLLLSQILKEKQKLKKHNSRTSSYPDKQTVFRVCEEGNPYSIALSSSSFVAVILLTGGELGLGAETTSYEVRTINCRNQRLIQKTQKAKNS